MMLGYPSENVFDKGGNSGPCRIAMGTKLERNDELFKPEREMDANAGL